MIIKREELRKENGKDATPAKSAALGAVSSFEKNKAEHHGTISGKVLFVDDDNVVRDLVKSMLKILGHHTDVASSGEDALLLLESNQYDLIISDIGMTAMSGWELAEKIKGRYANTKISLLTGWGVDVTGEEKEKFGLDYILGKPLTISELKKVVDEVLQAKYSTQEQDGTRCSA